ncbi:MAG TPA: UDP-N-acetylglucosamine 2-epimerase (non-hydrolyzing) [Candidatus Limnocylindrales bacterium]|nr:UDP-N-acetylglucosamine 2-epimerase (non-hydrolyzing) [Candidatus Limnocylindrales bacterium]
MQKKVVSVFGTRPEVIKLAPVIRELEARGDLYALVNVSCGEHDSALPPLTRLLGLRIDHELPVAEPGPAPSEVCARVLAALDPLLAREQPDLVLVQGDSTTAVAAALAAFHRLIPVGHVEAGLRSGDARSPFPEEMNRRLITQLAPYHFAATRRNRDTLLAEGVPQERIFVTGNPVVASLRWILGRATPGQATAPILEATEGLRRIVLTTDRREGGGTRTMDNLRALRRFVDRHADVALIAPGHAGGSAARAVSPLAGHGRIHLAPGLAYDELLALLTRAWLIVSDSSAIQEEAPTLGKPLLVLCDHTERPEAVEAGVARLVGTRPGRLGMLLEQAYRDQTWAARAADSDNPFGGGDSAIRIVHVIGRLLGAPRRAAAGEAT